MKNYNINLYPYVYDELEEIGLMLKRLAKSNKVTQDYLNKIKSTISSLTYFPERYKVISWCDDKAFRKVNVKKFSIFYYVKDNTVWISDILLSSTNKANNY
ncbi:MULTISPECIES: type II toxin-antitoxin system RelE/ParE family toxin [Lactobacillus]|uniref:Type II toxin-antitoxin system RelE/ParE family toxin n=1 Tax=Lactobacillus xujianguonis TaxID=2495899 RepID=A0A437ST78_9LACO|nr:type II toxin-antitoxin system RelE/ParE family toxin [Lactobacillus xujianguonis]